MLAPSSHLSFDHPVKTVSEAFHVNTRFAREMGEDKIPLDQQFTSFAKFGDNKADGKAIKLSNIDRWLKQAEVMGKKLTMTDTGVTFNKFKVKAITYRQFLKFLEELSNEKKIPLDEMKEKLESCGVPGAKKKEGAKPAVALPTGSTY